MQNQMFRPMLHRAAAIAGATAVLAACDNEGPLTARDECEVVRQTQQEVEAGQAEGKARVRLSVVSRLATEGGTTEAVSLKGAQLYLGNSCMRLENGSSPSLASLQGATGGLVGEVLVDAGDLTHILLDVAGPSGGTWSYQVEKIRLEEPIRLERGRRTDIFLTLSPVGTSKQVQTRVAASG